MTERGAHARGVIELGAHAAGVTECGAVAFGDSRIAYSILRSARRHKTVEITVARRGEVVVAAPLRTSVERIEAIVKRRAAWILRHGGLAERGPGGRGPGKPGLAERRFVSGESLPYLGRRVRLFVRETPEDGVDVRFHHWQFEVRLSRALPPHERSAAVEAAFTRWYRQRATELVAGRVERFAPLLGATPSRVLVRDQRRRWGSCSPDGVLRFNWRVVMAPPALLDYVVIHELAHLRLRAHGPRYWALVATAAPDYRERRQRLKSLGPSLYL